MEGQEQPQQSVPKTDLAEVVQPPPVVRVGDRVSQTESAESGESETKSNSGIGEDKAISYQAALRRMKNTNARIALVIPKQRRGAGRATVGLLDLLVLKSKDPAEELKVTGCTGSVPGRRRQTQVTQPCQHRQHFHPSCYLGQSGRSVAKRVIARMRLMSVTM